MTETPTTGTPARGTKRRRADLVVVGAGPAGSIAAIEHLRRWPGRRVVILDKDDVGRDKTCGDAVGPHATEQLAAWGLEHVLADHPRLTRACLAAPSGYAAQAEVEAGGVAIPRQVLDERLLRAAIDLGAEHRVEAVRRLSEESDHVKVNEWEAETVIGADGANSTIRRLLGGAGNTDDETAIALRAYAPDAAHDDTLHIHWGEERGVAYTWAWPVGDHPVHGKKVANIGAGMLLRDAKRAAARRGVSVKTLLREQLAEELPQYHVAPASVRAHLLPLSTSRPQSGRGRVLLAGDALSLINPLSGEGIDYALTSGRLAAHAAGERSGVRAYDEALRREIGTHLRDTKRLFTLLKHERVGRAGIETVARALRHSPRLQVEMLEVLTGTRTLKAKTAGMLPVHALLQGAKDTRGEPGKCGL